jgi:hypothetical protein
MRKKREAKSIRAPIFQQIVLTSLAKAGRADMDRFPRGLRGNNVKFDDKMPLVCQRSVMARRLVDPSTQAPIGLQTNSEQQGRNANSDKVFCWTCIASSGRNFIKE